MKTCIQCNQTYENVDENFYKQAGSIDGYESICKACRNKGRKRRRKARQRKEKLENIRASGDYDSIDDADSVHDHICRYCGMYYEQLEGNFVPNPDGSFSYFCNRCALPAVKLRYRAQLNENPEIRAESEEDDEFQEEIECYKNLPPKVREGMDKYLEGDKR